MRHVLCLLLFVLSGCSMVADAPEPSGTSDTSASSSPSRGPSPRSTTPAGFELWLAQQCPDGVAVSAQSTVIDAPPLAVPCERVREQALADPVARDQLVGVYTAQMEELPAGEPLGRAQEPVTPVGAFLCGLVATTPDVVFNLGPTGAAACHNPRLSHHEQTRCANVTAGGSIVLGILCGLAAIFL